MRPPTGRLVPPEHKAPAAPAIRTHFAIALQVARTFPRLVDLVAGAYDGDRLRVRRAARAIAHAILDGARDRGTGL